MKKICLAVIIFCLGGCINAFSEDGSSLWLRQKGGKNTRVVIPSESAVMKIARDELQKAMKGVSVILKYDKEASAKEEGFSIKYEKGNYIVSSPSEAGLLYASYHLIRMEAAGELTTGINVKESPAYGIRVLNHWDNPDGTIERGYAGESLWQWDELPGIRSERYEQYARANASVGINGTVLNNVNASPSILTSAYLIKVKALADIFRPYGIRVYLSVNFATPMITDNLATADPLDNDVRVWWKKKADEIYSLIPDFGGFLVKANSEGQPGPCDYGRSHADGANMLAEALQSHGGIIMWRAFVYSPEDSDRAKQAYNEFKPLDGKFHDNVIIQIKNGPIDFQPREPYSPLFGAMHRSKTMVEFQITQEYLGFSNHLVYLAPMWKEFFEFVPHNTLNAIAGVANTGTDKNWCGHHFAQSNWYAFGRLAWNPELTSEEIAEEWLKQTFSADNGFVESVRDLMTESREAAVNYMMPLGLHHIFAWGHHYGPEPWCDIDGARPDWMPSYYHNASEKGIGFDRSSLGSNAVAQYPPELKSIYDDLRTCPDEYILWFHNVPWTHKMQSGNTLWNELCVRYNNGVSSVRKFCNIWGKQKAFVDDERFRSVSAKLEIQLNDAVWWRDACLLYFGEFSGKNVPSDQEKPGYDLQKMKDFRLDITNFESPLNGYFE